mmetsp:Transcript_9822/g.27837  ORF Transcript_9822/g.27837 Transcript_9822/m.27837 type:complete len:230 (-) Transcript_9822:64-753(-)
MLRSPATKGAKKISLFLFAHHFSAAHGDGALCEAPQLVCPGTGSVFRSRSRKVTNSPVSSVLCGSQESVFLGMCAPAFLRHSWRPASPSLDLGSNDRQGAPVKRAEESDHEDSGESHDGGEDVAFTLDSHVLEADPVKHDALACSEAVWHLGGPHFHGLDLLKLSGEGRQLGHSHAHGIVELAGTRGGKADHAVICHLELFCGNDTNCRVRAVEVAVLLVVPLHALNGL